VGEFNPKNANEYDWDWYISIPVVRGGVQPEFVAHAGKYTEISIPVVRGGVQPILIRLMSILVQNFNSRGAWGSSTRRNV